MRSQDPPGAKTPWGIKLIFRFVSAFALLLGIATGSVAAIDEIDKAASSLNEALAFGQACENGPVRVGVFPFEENQLPITPENAFVLYENVLSELIRSAPPCVKYIDGRGAYLTLDYLAQAGTFRETGQSHSEEIEEALAGVDYVLDGSILDVGSAELRAVFRLTDFASGAAVGRVAFEVPERFQVAACGAGAQPMSVAIGRLATALSERAADMRRLTVVGGYYEHTDAQTEFSRFLEDLLVSELSGQMENSLTGRGLKVEFLREQETTALHKFRGVKLTPRQFEDNATHTDNQPVSSANTYRLKLRYWPCAGDEVARMSANLRADDGRSISEIVHIKLQDLPSGISIHPPETPVQANWGPDSAYSFQMSSQRGPNPIFRPGELFETLFRIGQDAWLYCFYTSSNGEVTQLLPNAYQLDDPNGNFYAGGRVHLFPDPERLPRPDPFDLYIDASTIGTEVFRCLATSRNVSDELPRALQGLSLDPVPPKYALRLRQVFDDLIDVRVAEASVTVTVLK